MRPKTISIIAIRIISVYWICAGLGNFFGPGISVFFPRMRADELFGSILMVLFVGAPHLILGFILWKKSEDLSALICKNLPDSPAETNSNSVEFLPLAISLLGLWVTVDNIPALLQYIVTHFWQVQTVLNKYPELSSQEIYWSNYTRIASSFLRVVFGFILIFGSERLSGLLHLARKAAQKNQT